ncbi:MAG: DUF5798 family protein [Halanaeroarchaeum sp.]
MGLGSTAKKLQNVVDVVEDLYAKLTEVREQVEQMRSTIETTSDRVERMETELADQRDLLEAIAEANDVEVPGGEAAETTEEEPAPTPETE